MKKETFNPVLLTPHSSLLYSSLKKSNEAYRDYDGISNSELSSFRNGVEYYLYEQKNKKTSTSSQSLGTLVHKYLLEKDSFYEEYVVSPKFSTISIPGDNTNILQFIVECVNKDLFVFDNNEDGELIVGLKREEDAVYNAILSSIGSKQSLTAVAKSAFKYKEYIHFLVNNKGKSYVSPEDYSLCEHYFSTLSQHLGYCTVSCTKSKNVKRFVEEPIVWQECIEINDAALIDSKITVPVVLKAKLDEIYVDYDKKVINLNDFKTDSDPVRIFRKSFLKYQYYRQLAFYKKALEIWALEHVEKDYTKFITEWTINVYITALHTKEPYEVAVYRLTQRELEEGTRTYQTLLSQLMWHKTNNIWVDSTYIKYQGIYEFNEFENYGIEQWF
jgi:hypothetical protein